MKSDYQLLEHFYYISPDGEQYPVFGGRRALMSFAGLGMPTINYITDNGPFVHGERVRGYKLDSRIIDISLYESGCKRQTRWENIGEIIDTVRMNRGGVGKILVVLPDWTEREIDAWILAGPGGNYQGDSGLLAFDINENLRFFAPYPIWRDPNAVTETLTSTVTESCLPMCLPICIGSATISSTIDITYPGTFESFPTITITGPIGYPVIRNVTTGKEIALLYNVSAGEVVTIELSPGRGLVYNNYGANLIGVVNNPNDLAEFSIEPESLTVPGGVNEIYVAGSGGILGTTQIVIAYYVQYLGVSK